MSADFGGSWWGQRWIEALERLSTAWQNRLPRGRDYARKGHVISLTVSPGKIAARVQGSRSKPYVTTIEVPPLRGSDWDLVIATLASEARFPAQLLIGIMPADIDDAFAEHNVNLFPARNSELLGSCTCPDKARPCKHIAAVHYAFGQALDRDPFLLFHVRGADRERLLEGFNKAWFGEGWDEQGGDVSGQAFDQGAAVLPMDADGFNRSPVDIESMSFAPLTPEPRLLILDRLGAPRCWTLPIAIEDLLGPVFEEATQLARKVAVERVDDVLRALPDTEIVANSGANDGYTSLALTDLTAPVHENLADRPKATFSLPRSLNVTSERIVKAPVAPPEETKRASRVIVRKGVTAARKDLKREDVAPKPAPRTANNGGPILPPADFVAHEAGSSGGPVLVRRGRGQTDGPAIVRRRGSGGIEIEHAVEAPDPAELRRGLIEEASEALAAGRPSEALRAASRLWAAEESLDAFLLLMKSADDADRKEEALQSEAARLVLRSRERNFTLSTPAALVLLCAAEVKVVADQIFALGKKGWRDDGPAGPVLLYSLRVLLAGKEIPDGSHLGCLWSDAEAETGTLDIDVGSVGSWLAWAADERPPPPTLNERLHRVSVELANWALGSASAVGGPEQAAVWACAVAETVAIAKIEGGAMPFLASLQTQLARKKRMMGALEQALGESSVLS